MPINKGEVSKFLRLSDIFTESVMDKIKKLSEAEKEDIKALVGETITEEIKRELGSSKSPVSKGSFKSSKADGSRSELFETGDLWASIVWENTRNGLKVGVFDDGEAPKAFNHNTGDTLPKREFIPSSSGKFKKTILDKVKRLVKARLDDSEV